MADSFYQQAVNVPQLIDFYEGLNRENKAAIAQVKPAASRPVTNSDATIARVLQEEFDAEFARSLQAQFNAEQISADAKYAQELQDAEYAAVLQMQEDAGISSHHNSSAYIDFTYYYDYTMYGSFAYGV